MVSVLGKDHLEISLIFSLPFILYSMICVISFDLPVYVAILFPFCIVIGSLLPDADCNGKPSLYYKYKSVFFLMRPIYMFILSLIKQFVKKYPDYIFEVEEEHRGILHSLTGVFLSSFCLSLIFSFVISILLYFSDLFTLKNIFYIFISGFCGLLLGQILHLIEDSYTKSGVKWFLPFSQKLIQGNISTKSERGNILIDIRPRYFAKTLKKVSIFSSFLILLIWALYFEFFIFSLIIILLIQNLVLAYFYWISQEKLEGSKWNQSLKEWKNNEKKDKNQF